MSAHGFDIDYGYTPPALTGRIRREILAELYALRVAEDAPLEAGVRRSLKGRVSP